MMKASKVNHWTQGEMKWWRISDPKTADRAKYRFEDREDLGDFLEGTKRSVAETLTLFLAARLVECDHVHHPVCGKIVPYNAFLLPMFNPLPFHFRNMAGT